MKTLIPKILAIVGLLVLPIFGFAALYQYVDVSGNVKTVAADTPEAAIQTAVGIHPKSGVMMIAGSVATYEYVDVNGVLRKVLAPNAEVALQTAVGIAPRSGVRLVSGASATVGVNTGLIMYQYVDTMGALRIVFASDAETALRIATNRDPNSGVRRI